ncbi:MAG: S1 RNA-binding domain-containing protein, partial [Lentisphaeria bacterium]|nr:S1 RNA-binding domain-containing protein [Lentisphaeria bacterium]
MERRIGEVYDGVISGVTNWGIYVELPNTVEGIIRLENVQDDFYRFD